MFKKVIYNCATKKEKIEEYTQEEKENIEKTQDENNEICLNIRVKILEDENADLLLDAAIKDSKIEMLENDLADVMMEIAMIGEVR